MTYCSSCSAWIPNTELNPLEPGSEDVTNPSEKGKSKTLLAAYAKAAEANGLEAFKTMLMEHEKAIQEDLALQEERAAKKAEKAKKAAARKSSEARANDDDMDVDEENGTEKPKAKKRKKVADESDIDEKVVALDPEREDVTDVLSPQRHQRPLPS